jgi:hypothetical protein
MAKNRVFAVFQFLNFFYKAISETKGNLRNITEKQRGRKERTERDCKELSFCFCFTFFNKAISETKATRENNGKTERKKLDTESAEMEIAKNTNL